MPELTSKERNPTSVLVTRPRHQSAPFITQLEEEGFSVVLLPTIEIEFAATDLSETLRSDLIIFTSANAVTGAHNSLKFPWNTEAKTAAIGKATAEALNRLNCPVDIVPRTAASTEALLDALSVAIGDVTNLVVTIVRGDSGRDKLFTTLSAQNAKPRYQTVYKRALPEYSPVQLELVFKDGVPDIISVTSDLGLINLLAIVPSGLTQKLLSRPVIVNSERCAQLARDKGFNAEILVANPAETESQLSRILSLR